jgi:hypothetical protein
MSFQSGIFHWGVLKYNKKIFRNHQIDLVYSNKGKLKDSLGNPKDKTEMLAKIRNLSSGM